MMCTLNILQFYVSCTSIKQENTPIVQGTKRGVQYLVVTFHGHLLSCWCWAWDCASSMNGQRSPFCIGCGLGFSSSFVWGVIQVEREGTLQALWVLFWRVWCLMEPRISFNGLIHQILPTTPASSLTLSRKSVRRTEGMCKEAWVRAEALGGYAPPGQVCVNGSSDGALCVCKLTRENSGRTGRDSQKHVGVLYKRQWDEFLSQWGPNDLLSPDLLSFYEMVFWRLSSWSRH